MPLPHIRQLDRSDWLTAASVFVLALSLRLVFLFTSPDHAWPHSILYEGDAPTWVDWAQKIETGQPFEFNLPLRSPAVAYLLAWLSPGEVQGPFTAFKVLWCVASAAACSLAYLGFASVFPRRVSLIAATLSTFAFADYIIATSLNNETPYLLALMAIVLATLQLVRLPRVWLAILLGLLHGGSMLLRAEHLLLLLLMLGFLAWSLGLFRMSLKPIKGGPMLWVPLVTAITAMLTCLLWSIHGSLATQRFNTVTKDIPDYEHADLPWTTDGRAFIDEIPAFARDGTVKTVTFIGKATGLTQITRQDAINILLQHYGYVHEPLSSWTFLSLKGPLDFALANHPSATGGFTKAALQMPGEGEVKQIALGRPDHLKLINHGYGVGWGYITSDFGGWLGRVRGKLVRFTDGITQGFTSRNLPVGLSGERRAVDIFTANGGTNPVHRIVNDGWRITIIILLAGGVLVMLSRKTAAGGVWLLIIAYKVIVTILFYGYARQAVSILPEFFLLVALSIDFLLGKAAAVWTPTRRQITVAAGLFAAILVVVDITGSAVRPQLSFIGTCQFTPQWGEDAFEAVKDIEIRPAGVP